MIPELGQFALVLATCTAALQALAPLVLAERDDDRALAVARRASVTVMLLCLAAGASLAWSFAANDFSVRYVVAHSHSDLPLAYRLTAVWGSHEGSMLLWLITLSAWGAAAAWRSGPLPTAVALRMASILGWIGLGLLLFVVWTSNPFLRLLPAASEGQDLNALLQDPGMVFHPPLLYLGYVGFAIPFAFVVAAMWAGRLGTAELRWIRPWALFAWAALGVGIVLGSSWAYRVLGWGGWWFWDPVENASLLPWLAGLALLHALAAAETRGHFKRWVVLLAVAAFAFSLIGTFIVRSGAITSVHAFATDPQRGVFILALLVASVGGALMLYGARAPERAGQGPFDRASREALLLANTALFSVAAATVLLATLYPMALDALGMGKISVGAPYFEAVLVPLLAPALFLMALGPMARWQRGALPSLARQLRWALLASFAVAGVAWWLGRSTPLVVLGLFLSSWVLLASLASLRQNGTWPRRWSAWGTFVAHAGVGVFLLGVTVVKGFQVEREVALAPGASAMVGPYVLRLERSDEADGPNYDVRQAHLLLLDGDKPIATLVPQSRVYRVRETTVSVPAIHATAWRDVYVALGEPLGGGAWGVRLQFKPLIAWVWAGFLMMSAGALVAACDRRYRHRPVAQTPPPMTLQKVRA